MALRHLRAAGLQLVTRNYRCHRGELDLVMRQGEMWVFVEVRQRASGRFGDAAETVDWRKRARLVATAAHFLQSHPGAARSPCRFDVVAVNGPPSGAQLRWIANAFAG
jgi:putative endonuclease